MTDSNIETLKKETYLAMLRNSPGTRLFNSLFVRFKDTGETHDVLNNGEYSCAFFVTGILTILGVLDKPSSTVASTKKHLQEKGWLEISGEEQAGDVIFWEPITFEDGSVNAHVGFALDNQRAVSTDYKQKMVVAHNVTFDGARKIESILRPPESFF